MRVFFEDCDSEDARDEIVRLIEDKAKMEKAARALLDAAREALTPDGEARERYESAVSAMEALLGESTEQ